MGPSNKGVNQETIYTAGGTKESQASFINYVLCLLSDDIRVLVWAPSAQDIGVESGF